MEKEQLYQEAITIVKNEVQRDATWQITDKVAFDLRKMVEYARKNYWGVFDNPKDKNTGKEKTWVPLTRVLTDGAFKNSDVDSKDVSFRATSRIGRHYSTLIRGYVRRWLKDLYYGELIDQDRLRMIIDGTLVWKTYTMRVGGKLKVVRKTLDLLNCYIDPTADNIQTAYRFTERSLLTEDDLRQMEWENKNAVAYKVNSVVKEDGIDSVTKKGKFVEVYEMWGKIPKYLITGNAEDTRDIDGHIIVSGLDTKATVHLIEENKTKDRAGNIIKPYEEAWYTKVPGRWYGVGIPETVMQLQERINLVVHLRNAKNVLAQTGLLKWRSNKEISQQMVSSLISNGVIQVSDKDDLTSLDIMPAGQDSYTDEEVIKKQAQEVTAIFDVNLGAPMPASTSATGAVIQSQAGKSAFVIVKEAWGQFQQRWIERHVMPHMAELMKQDKVSVVFGDFENIAQVRQGIVAHYAMQALEEEKNKGRILSEMEVQKLMQDMELKLRQDNDIFFDVIDEVLTEGIYTEVYFTNESVDTAVVVRNLIDLSNMIQDQAVKNDFVASALDLLNIPIPQSLLSAPTVAPEQGMQGMQKGDLGMVNNQSLQEQVTDLNTMPSNSAPTAL